MISFPAEKLYAGKYDVDTGTDSIIGFLKLVR